MVIGHGCIERTEVRFGCEHLALISPTAGMWTVRISGAIVDDGRADAVFLGLLYGALSFRPDGSTNAVWLCFGAIGNLRERAERQADKGKK